MARDGNKAGGMNEVAKGHGRDGKGYTPNVVALNKGKTKSEMPIKKSSSEKGGDYWKKAKTSMSLGSHKDMSSGESLPRKGSDDNKKRYSGEKQPTQFSNGAGPQCTKFVV